MRRDSLCNPRIRFVRALAVAISSLVLGLGVALASDVEGPPSIVGAYTREDAGQDLVVESIERNFYKLKSSEGWEGVGILDGKIYRGVFQYTTTRGPMAGRMGVHTIDWTVFDRPTLYATFVGPALPPVKEIWERLEAEVLPSSSDPDHPRFGDYVFVEQLPEAITKVPPVYPDAAREARIDGLVMVQALVLKDGTVGDTRVVKSIPELDEAAVASVRQFKFKPGMTKGKPVACWFAVPIRFTLH